MASKMALGKPVSIFIYQLAAPLQIHWWKSISQPDMPLLIITFHGTFLLVSNAFTWSPSVSASLSSCLPSSQPVKTGRFCFFPLLKRIPGTRSFKLLWSFLSQGLILFLIPVPPTSSCGVCMPLWLEQWGNMAVLITAAHSSQAWGCQEVITSRDPQNKKKSS